MRRRQVEPSMPVPVELVEFAPAVWELHGGLDGWLTARRVWLREDRQETVDDPIDWLQKNVAVKPGQARRAACSSPLVGGTPTSLVRPSENPPSSPHSS
jgi:hypothetical protein